MIRVKHFAPLLTTFCFLLFVFYFVYSIAVALDKTELESRINQFVENYFDQAEVSYSNISVQIGTSAEVLLDNVYVRDGAEDVIFRADEMSVRIPYYAIFGGGGRIHLNFYSPEVNYSLFTSSFNAQKFLGDEVGSDFLDRNRIGVRAYNFAFEMKGPKEKVYLDKILIKNISNHINTAFEVETKLNLKNLEGENIDVGLYALGEFSLAKFLQQGEIDSHYMLRLIHRPASDLRMRTSREARGRGRLKSSVDGDISGELTLRGDEGNFSGHFEVRDREFYISDISARVPFPVLDIVLDSPIISQAKYRNHYFSFSGNLLIEENLRLRPELRFEVDRKFDFEFTNLALNNSVMGQLGPDYFDINLQSQLLGGELDYQLIGGFEFYLTPGSQLKLDQVKSVIQVKDINLHHANLRGESLFASFRQLFDMVQDTVMPLERVDFVISNLYWGENQLNGEGYFEQIEDEETNLKFEASYSEGDLKLFVSRELEKFNASLRMEKLNLEGITAFLPDDYRSIRGIVDGVLQLNWKDRNFRETVQGHISLTADDGNLRPLLREFELPGMSGVNQFVETSSLDERALANFLNLRLELEVLPSNLEIGVVHYKTQDDEIELAINGVLNLDGEKKSELFVVLQDPNSIIIPSSFTRTSKVPFRFVGEGLKLKPDILYTLKQMTQGSE